MPRFAGETHGCYSDSLQMTLGPAAPGEWIIEILTGSPFGMCMYDDDLPLFNPPGWTPELGITNALDLLGFEYDQVAGDPDEAVRVLREACLDSPVFVGPTDMGMLMHQPGSTGPMGVDHYLTVIGVEGDDVVMHDPRAQPFSTLPLEKFLAAWRTGTLPFRVEPYTARFGFRPARPVDVPGAVRRMLPAAAEYTGGPRPAAAAERAAAVIEAGVSSTQYFHLAAFMICAGARRRGDAAVLLAELGYQAAARTLEQQARLIGSMEYPLVNGDHKAVAAAFRRLAPTFGRLHGELLDAISD